MILFYAPGWWLRIPVVCTPFSWEDTLGMIREKLGKKKKVRLPQSLTVPVPPKGRRAAAAPAPRPEQMQMEIPEMPEAEEAPAADETGPAESAGEEPDA